MFVRKTRKTSTNIRSGRGAKSIEREGGETTGEREKRA